LRSITDICDFSSLSLTVKNVGSTILGMVSEVISAGASIGAARLGQSEESRYGLISASRYCRNMVFAVGYFTFKSFQA
jgi:hypothetical protein